MTRITLLLFLLTLPAIGQRGNSSSDSNRQSMLSLDVRIVTEDEQRVSDNVRVQLLKFGGTPAAEIMAMDGMAQFSGIAPGAYAVRVTGPSIEETTTPVFEVRPAGFNSMQIVRVKLRPTGGTTGSTQGSVSAQDLNIPSKAKKEFNKAGDAMQQADWKKAKEHLQKAVAIYPKYAAAYNNLGVVAMKQNDLATATTSFEKAIELNDSSGSAYLNLGRIYLKDRNYEETLRLMNKALALDANNPEALTILAYCDVVTGKYADAITATRHVHANPHERFAVAHLIAAAAFEKQNDAKDAAAEYEQFLKEDPSSPRAAGVRKALQRLSAVNHPAGIAPGP